MDVVLFGTAVAVAVAEEIRMDDTWAAVVADNQVETASVLAGAPAVGSLEVIAVGVGSADVVLIDKWFLAVAAVDAGKYLCHNYSSDTDRHHFHRYSVMPVAGDSYSNHSLVLSKEGTGRHHSLLGIRSQYCHRQ